MTTTRHPTDGGLRLIVAYKLTKAVGQLALAAFLGFVLASGAQIPVGRVAAALGRHATAAWSLRIAELLGRAATPHAIELTIAALVGDGALTLCEGWALHRRFAWAPWLVVVATGSLLPFEVFELLARPSAVRLLVVLVNLAIVWYLAAHATRESRMRRAA